MNKKIIGAVLVGTILLAGCNKVEEPAKFTWILTKCDTEDRIELTDEQNDTLNAYAETEMETGTVVPYQTFTDNYQAVINLKNEDIQTLGTTYLITDRCEIYLNSYVYDTQDTYYEVEYDSQLGQYILSLIGDNQYIDVETDEAGNVTYVPAPYIPTPNPDAFTWDAEMNSNGEA